MGRVKNTFPAGRKAVVDDGVVKPVADDAMGRVDYWVCPRVDEHRSQPPFEIGECAHCGAAITFRDTPRARMMISPTAQKICGPCIVELSEKE